MRLWHTGDNIAILSFKTKMHTVSNEVLDGVLRAVDEAEANFSALILWQTEPPFSAGANLLQLMQGVQEAPRRAAACSASSSRRRTASNTPLRAAAEWATCSTPQPATCPRWKPWSPSSSKSRMRLKYAQVPTIAAVDGLALGGGCEFSIHCTRIVATLESYIGLVEVGVGLLPAGGGCKEMAQRAAAEAHVCQRRPRDIFPFLRRYFQNIAMGEVAKSAEMAREMGYLRQSDRIVLNRFELLHIAKEEAKALNATAYRPPLHQRQIAVAGRTGIATLKAADAQHARRRLHLRARLQHRLPRRRNHVRRRCGSGQSGG